MWKKRIILRRIQDSVVHDDRLCYITYLVSTFVLSRPENNVLASDCNLLLAYNETGFILIKQIRHQYIKRDLNEARKEWITLQPIDSMQTIQATFLTRTE